MKTKSDKTIYRQLFTLVLPIAFQNLMSSAVSASDALMLGMLDQDSLSAISLATQVAFFIGLFFFGIASGATVLTAQYWGKGDEEAVKNITAIALRYSMLVGLVGTILAFVAPQLLMRIFTDNPVLIKAGALYLRVVALSYFLTGFSQIYLTIMKNCGKALQSSIIGSISVVLNIVLNGVLIFGLIGAPRMGIKGAALATVLARLFECIASIVIMLRGNCVMVSISRILNLPSIAMKNDFWKYTLPILINQLGWGGGVTMYPVIMGHLGSDATAANSIANIVRSMTASLCWGVAAGVGIILGNMMGRGELDKAKREGGRFVRLSIVIGVLSGLVIIAMIPSTLVVVKLSVRAKHYLKGMLFLASYYIIGNSLNSTIISGIFVAGGDTKFGMICDLITLWAVIVPMGFLAAFVFKWPVMVVAFILTLDEFVKIPAVYIHYMKYKWVKNLTRD